MTDLINALALWALVSGAGIAVGALSRIALDAWEAKERARLRAWFNAMEDHNATTHHHLDP